MALLVRAQVPRKEFLKTVLPELPPPANVVPGFGPAIRYDGYVSLGLMDGQRRQTITGSIDGLCVLTDEIVTTGGNAYFALSGFAEGHSSRKATEAACVRSIWADIDASKADSKYANAQEAMAGLLEFCQKTKLLPTYIVSSGRGLHVYWSFDRNIDPVLWKRVASLFLHVAKGLGLDVDSHRACDLASVLRVPESIHQSSGKKVTVIAKGKIWELEEFVSKLVTVGKTLPPPARPAMPAAPARPTTAALAGMNDAAGDIREVVKYCPAFREAFHRGYPEWFAALSICKGCAHGEKAAHILSARCPEQYDAVNTQRIFDSIERPPTLCARFNEVMPDACARCKFKGRVKSPIWFGYHPGAIVEQPPAESPKYQPVVDYVPIWDKLNAGTGIVPVTDLAGEFYVNERGSWALVQTRNGQMEMQLFAERIYFLYSGVHMKSLGGMDKEERFEVTRFFCYQVHYLDGSIGVITLEAEHLCTWQSLNILLKNHKLIANHKVQGNIVVAFFNAYIERLRGEKNRRELPQYDTFGWNNYISGTGNAAVRGFVVMDKIITADGLFPCTHSQKAMESKDNHVGAKGSLSQWKQAAKLFRVLDELPAMFMLALSFAAPLMELMPGEARNGVFSLWSTATGMGKTTAIRFAASVWGNPYGASTLFTKSESLVARTARLATLKNIPAFMDELTDIDDKTMSNLIFSLCNGKEKNKLKSSGAEFVQTGNWNTITFMTANTSAKAAVARESKGTDATMYRIMEYACDFPNFTNNPTVLSLIEKCCEVIKMNYGLAGPDFLYQLFRTPSRLANFPGMVSAWVKEHGFAQEERFISYPIGAVAVILDWLTEYGYVDFPVDRMIYWMTHQLISQNRSDTAMYRELNDVTVGDFLNKHLDNMLVVKRAQRHKDEHDVGAALGAIDKYVIHRPKAFLAARFEQEARVLYVSAREFSTWCIRMGLELKHVLGTFSKEGVQCKNTKYTLAKGVSCYPSVPVKCYKFFGGTLSLFEPPRSEEARVPGSPVPTVQVAMD